MRVMSQSPAIVLDGMLMMPWYSTLAQPGSMVSIWLGVMVLNRGCVSQLSNPELMAQV